MLDWFAQADASLYLPAGQFKRHLYFASSEFEKAKWKTFQRHCFLDQTEREDHDVCRKIGVLKSPFCCSSPLRIPKVIRPSKTYNLLALRFTRSQGSQERSGNFQLCVGFCFKQLLTQFGRSPNLIFFLNISAWFCVHHSFVSELGGVDRPQPSQNWHCSSPIKERCKGPHKVSQLATVKYNFCQFCINMCIGRSVWSWKLRSLSVWSKRIAWNLKRHWFEAVFVPTDKRWTSNAACWQEHTAAPMGETENANPWHMWWKQDGTHPLDKASRANHEQWNRDWSILFRSCSGQMKYCKVQHQQAVDPESICPTSNARMKVTCFGDVSNTWHMLVTSHKNHSDACLWQPFWQTLAWCQIVSAAAQSGARMGFLSHICHACSTWNWPLA